MMLQRTLLTQGGDAFPRRNQPVRRPTGTGPRWSLRDSLAAGALSGCKLPAVVPTSSRRLAGLEVGDRLDARVPGLGREVELRVTALAPLADFATWRSTSASGGFDLKTFEVRARPAAPVEGLRPGMSAIVDWGRRPR